MTMLWTGCLQQEPCFNPQYGIFPHFPKAPSRGFFMGARDSQPPALFLFLKGVKHGKPDIWWHQPERD